MKIFHIIFISVCSVISFLVGILGIYTHFNEDNKFFLLLGLLAILFSMGLIVYGIFFLQKMKGIK